jgi:predicted metal-binding membrane protein
VPSGRLLFAVALLGAGVWQLTPLKHACLRRCRTPLGFLIVEWRPGARGALVLGARHGTECVLCCWALMAVMLGVGTMSLAAMVVLTALMVAEKVAPGGHHIGRAAAVILFAWGGWQLVRLA